MAFEENEISKNSQGGTESVKRGLAERLPEGLADDFQIICSRVRKIEEDKIRIYWLHDLPEDPETNHLKDQNSRDRFHKRVYCSNWQYQRYQLVCGFPYDKNDIVIETPIDPIPEEEIEKDKDQIRLIYTSTPQRGLNILIPVVEELAKEHKDIHLDVFSSYKIYGWEDSDKQFEPLYDRIRKHPNMTYHGFQPNDKVKDALKRSHIFAYPNIWLECNSRSLIEAMSAKNMCVHPNLGGLADTSGALTFQYQGDHNNNEHASIFFHALKQAVNGIKNEPENTNGYLSFIKAYADTRFNWNKIVTQWTDLLVGLKAQYPDVNSRKLPNAKVEKFTYDTN